MTQKDRWAKRKCVLRYFEYKDRLLEETKRVGFVIGPRIKVKAFIQMPKSWSKKKKAAYDQQPHQQKPDADNIMKGVKDALCEDDSFIWDEQIQKYWAYEGRLLITNVFEES